jgi:hypothetical protein
MPEHVMTICLLAHAGATWFMVGLIWFVQVVHYPLMKVAATGDFLAYSKAHLARTPFVVGPVMLVEGCSAVLLVWGAKGWFTGGVLAWAGLALMLVICAVTFVVHVPLHQRLSAGFDDVLWRRLVASNWARTWAWSARGVIALLMLRVH